MRIWAFNKIGKGEPSDLFSTSTRGKGKLSGLTDLDWRVVDELLTSH